jgi:hypothetical protein
MEHVDKTPAIAAGSAPRTTSGPPNAVGIDGVDYQLPPGLSDEAFVRDLLNMEGDELVRKYSLVPCGAVAGSDKSCDKFQDRQQQQQQQQ